MPTKYKLKEYDRMTGDELNSYTTNKSEMIYELMKEYELTEDIATEWLDSLEGNKKMIVPSEDIDIVLSIVKEGEE